MILREAHRLGVQHMVVTHAMNPPVEMTVAQMQEAVKEGAFIEFVGGALKKAADEARMDRFAAAIKTVGAAIASCPRILARRTIRCRPTASPRSSRPCRSGASAGADLDRMSKQNPASLLGLP